jgi:hypothetical protein
LRASALFLCLYLYLCLYLFLRILISIKKIKRKR